MVKNDSSCHGEGLVSGKLRDRHHAASLSSDGLSENDLDEMHQIDEDVEDEDSSFLVHDARKKELEAREGTIVSTALLEIADVVGVGFLTLPSAMSDLGWGIGLFLLIIMCPINVYAGILISRACEITPHATNYIDMARMTWKDPNFHSFVSLLFHSYILGTLGSYLLALGKVLSMVMTTEGSESWLCTHHWSLLVCFVLVPLIQLQTLNASKTLLWVNVMMITFSLFLAISHMLIHMQERVDVETEFIAKDLNWIGFCSALSKFAFAYLGVYVYIELRHEMKDPKDFPQTFIISGPAQLLMYMFVAITGYAYFGKDAQGMIIEAIPKSDFRFKLASLSLLFYLLVAYLVKSTVLSRAIFRRFGKTGASGSKSTWFFISTGILASCYFMANAVPVFDDAVSLLGSLQSPILGFVLPALFLFLARRKMRCELPLNETENVAIIFYIGFGATMCVIATAASLFQIGHHYSAGKLPFSC